MHIRKHVLSDLQPYVCTYPDCQLHDHFFENKNDWYRHESHTHRVEWFCNTMSHGPFINVEDFLDHMHAIHSEPLDKAQLLSLHHGFQQPSNAHSGTCTLCGEYASKIRSHLARHLEQLALFAIPQTDYMAHWEEDDTSSNAARQSAPASFSSHSVSHSSAMSSEVSDPYFKERESGDRDSEDVHSTVWEEKVEPDASYQGEEFIDTSWDWITPKFKEARIAMRYEQEAKIPVVLEDMTPPLKDSSEMHLDPDLPRSPLESSSQRLGLSVRRYAFSEWGSTKPNISEWFSSSEERDGRRQKESQPEDDVYPKVAWLYDPPQSEDRGGAYEPPSPSSGDNPERWPEVPGERLRSPKLKKLVVWYCSHCSDGPIGSWQNSCTNCSHVRCGGCTVEVPN